MSKNDFFVVAYRILSYLYECFMMGEKPDLDMYSPEALKINNGYWTNVMETLSDDGYIKGITFVPRTGGAPGIKLSNPKITAKGIEYLQENSAIQKAKSFLKELKEIVPGF